MSFKDITFFNSSGLGLASCIAKGTEGLETASNGAPSFDDLNCLALGGGWPSKRSRSGRGSRDDIYVVYILQSNQPPDKSQVSGVCTLYGKHQIYTVRWLEVRILRLRSCVSTRHNSTPNPNGRCDVSKDDPFIFISLIGGFDEDEKSLSPQHHCHRSNNH